MQIDVIICCHEKDLNIIDYCLKGIHDNISFNRIMVIANRNLRYKFNDKNVIFIDEDTVIEGLQFSTYAHKGPRWGWYFQQILKLGMADMIDTPYYLSIDADTVFLRGVGFFDKNSKPLYATGNAYHAPYFHFFNDLLGFIANREYSFIVHHMVFNRNIVIEMRNRFSNDQVWYDKIVSCVGSPISFSLFSEFETYGHYLKAYHPDELNIRKLRWSNVSVEPSEKALKRLSEYLDYCSFHEFLRVDQSQHKRLKRKMEFEFLLVKEKFLDLILK